jgi:hypothetical protein
MLFPYGIRSVFNYEDASRLAGTTSVTESEIGQATARGKGNFQQTLGSWPTSDAHSFGITLNTLGQSAFA